MKKWTNRPLTPLEAIIANLGLEETNISIGSSFVRGCKVWKTQIPDVFATNYNIQAEHGASLVGKDCLYFFNMGNKERNQILLSFAMLKGKLNLPAHIKEFLRSK